MRWLRILMCGAMLQLFWTIAGCCPDMETFVYRWESVSALHLDNSGAQPVESSSDRLPARAYGIRMKLEHKQVVAMRFSPIPAAYATTCEPPVDNLDTIKTLHIYSLGSDSASTLQEVTNQFRVVMPGITSARSFITIPDLLRELNDDDAHWTQQVDFLRMMNHDPSDGIRFIISLEMANGRTLGDTTTAAALL